MLVIQDLVKSYPDAAGQKRHVVLDGLSLNVARGETLAIAGPSGSGKTTLLNIISTLDRPDSGSILFEGEEIQNLRSDMLSRFRNRKIGMVFQFHHLLPQCTLWENVLIPTIPYRENGERAEERAENLLKQTGIWNLRDQKPARLSGGECQRAAVVRALINQPSLLLADEPTGALDRDNAHSLVDLLLELNAGQGTSLIMVTHSAELAGKMGTVYSLQNGRFI